MKKVTVVHSVNLPDPDKRRYLSTWLQTAGPAFGGRRRFSTLSPVTQKAQTNSVIQGTSRVEIESQEQLSHTTRYKLILLKRRSRPVSAKYNGQ